MTPARRPLELAIGERCQDRCIFCSDVPDVEVSVPADRLLVRMREGRADGAATLELSGLEPTIRPDFVELVHAARKLGYGEIQVVTNGRRFADAAFTTAAVEAGLNSAIVSVHGHTRSVEEAIVGQAESFEEKVAGIRALAAAFLRARLRSAHHARAILEVNTVVTTENLGVLPAVVAFLSRLGVARVNLHAVRPYGWALRNFDAAVPPLGVAGRAAVEAARHARSLGTAAFVCDFPPCVLGDGTRLAGRPEDKKVLAVLKSGAEQPLEGLTKKAQHKVKGEPCADCRASAACEGVYREYVHRRGWGEIHARE